MYFNMKTGCLAVGTAGKNGEYRLVGDKKSPLLKFSLAVGKGPDGKTLWFDCQAWSLIASAFKNRIRRLRRFTASWINI